LKKSLEGKYALQTQTDGGVPRRSSHRRCHAEWYHRERAGRPAETSLPKTTPVPAGFDAAPQGCGGTHYSTQT
jgi:hypothetical protein